MSLRRRITIGTIWSAVGSWGEQFFAFLIFLVLARLLGPKAYGLVGMAMVVTGFGIALVARGFSWALVQRKELEPGHLDAAFWFLSVFAVALMLAAIASADHVAALFDEPVVAELLRWLSPVLVLSALSAVPIAILRRDIKFGILTARSLIGIVAGGAVGISMALLGYGVWSLVAHQLTIRIVEVLAVWTTCHWRPGFRASWRHFHDLRRYGVNQTGASLIGFLNEYAPRFMIGLFLGPVALGHFTLAWRVIEILMFVLIMPFSNVALPAFAHVQDRHAEVQRMMLAGIRFSTLMALPCYLGVGVVAPDLVPTMFGAQWTPGVPVLQILALVGLPMCFIAFNNTVLTGLGKAGWQLILTVFSTVTIVLLLLLVSKAGIIAVALALIARGYLTWPFGIFIVRRLTRVRYGPLIRGSTPQLLAALLMAASVWVWRSLMEGTLPRELLLATSIALGAAIYAGAILVVARPLVGEALELLRTVRGKRPSPVAEQELPEEKLERRRMNL